MFEWNEIWTTKVKHEMQSLVLPNYKIGKTPKTQGKTIAKLGSMVGRFSEILLSNTYNFFYPSTETHLEIRKKT